MYSVYKQIKDVINYKTLDKNLAFVTSNNELIFNSKKIVEQNESYFLIDEIIGYHTGNNETYFFNDSGNKVKSFDVIFYPENLIDNNFTSSKSHFRNETGNWESDLYLFNYDPFYEIKKYKNNIEGGNLFRIDNEFIQYGKFFVKFLNVDTSPLWTFNLESLGAIVTDSNETKPIEVRQFIGVHENTLWLYLSCEWLLAIDINTGDQKTIIKSINRNNLVGDINEYLEEKDELRILNTKFTLDESKGLIHGLIYDKYYQIDLTEKLPIPKLFGLQAQFSEAGVNPGSIDRRYCLVKDVIYFAAYEQGRFGILNTQTKEIVYFSKQFTEHRLKDIQVADNKVYVLDHNNTLHIFEEALSDLE